MKLTNSEKKICKQYSARDKQGYVHCFECPLNICKLMGVPYGECYITIDGRTSLAKSLKRY